MEHIMRECPLCGRSTVKASTRLIKDACGHSKCRLCLLQEESGCSVCKNENSIKFPQRNVSSNNSGTPNYTNCEIDCQDQMDMRISKNYEYDSPSDEDVLVIVDIDEDDAENIQKNQDAEKADNKEDRNKKKDEVEKEEPQQYSSLPTQSLENNNQSLSRKLVLTTNEVSNEIQQSHYIINQDVDSGISNNIEYSNSTTDEKRHAADKQENIADEIIECQNHTTFGNQSNEISNDQTKTPINNTPNHLVGYVSPRFRLSDYLLFKKKNDKVDCNEIILSPAHSIGYRSPDFKLSDYLLFKKGPNIDDQLVRIEQENENKRTNSLVYVNIIKSSDNHESPYSPSAETNNSISEEIELQNQYEVVNHIKDKTLETIINKSLNSFVQNGVLYEIEKQLKLDQGDIDKKKNDAEQINCEQLNNICEPIVNSDTNSDNYISVDSPLIEKKLNIHEDTRLEENDNKKVAENNDEDKENKRKLHQKNENELKTKEETNTVRKNIKPQKKKKFKPSILKRKCKNRQEQVKESDVIKGVRKGERKTKRNVQSNEESNLEVIKKPAVKRRKPNKDWSHIITLPSSPVSYKCTVCEKVFRSFSCRCYHSACRLGKPAFQCTICDRTFSKRSHFEYHERMHSGDKPFQCNQCGKRFIQKNKLNRHLFVHKQQHDIECNECGKKFGTKQYLKSHMTTHMDNSFKCRFCSKTFSFDPNRKRHERSHLSDRPFKCDVCSKSFKDKSLMSRHRKTHEKIRPFSCSNCKKVFLSKFEVQRHMLVHSDVKQYACEYCSLKFRRKDNLHRHVKHHHPDIDPACSREALTDNRSVEPVIENSSKEKQIDDSTFSANKSNRRSMRKKKETNDDTENTPKTSPKLKAKPKKVSRSNSTSSKSSEISQRSSMGKSKSTNVFPMLKSPVSIQRLFLESDSSAKLRCTDPIPRQEAIDLNRMIEENIHGQNSFSNFPGFPRRVSPIRRRGSCGSNSNSNDDINFKSKQNVGRLKTAYFKKNEPNGAQKTDQSTSVKKDVYMHWRRRTAEALKPK